MIVTKYLRRSLIYVSVAFLFLLPHLTESCTSCFHTGSVPQKHNHGQAIAIAVPRGANPYGTSEGTNSLAVATTAVRQISDVFRKRCLNFRKFVCASPQVKKSFRISASAALVAGGMIALAHHHVPITTRQKIRRSFFRKELADSQGDSNIRLDDNEAEDDLEPGTKGEGTEGDESVTSTAMIATIGIYKNFISPLLPPACRFVPTCSQYGVQAIKEYGPSKGVVLTSWRILRCSPFGGKGYDPPKWPPVSYTYSSY